MKKAIPAVWRIDVEPDEHQPSVGESPWHGLVATEALVEGLRERLGSRSGHPVHPTWFLRLDPDVERCFGRVDFVVHRHRELFDRIQTRQDPLGIHVHPYRWDPERKVAFSDHADPHWTDHCLTVACEAFARSFHQPLKRSSFGGYFLTEASANAAIAHGIQVDVTSEPGLEPKAMDVSFGAYATAASGDFQNWPRRPYYPSTDALNVPAVAVTSRRPLLIVPLTSYDHQTALTSWPRRIAKILLRRPRRAQPLNPWKWWPSPKIYWDLVARAADESPACYFAFAIRTETPGSVTDLRVRELLEHLPQHPIAERLQFVDPLGPEIRALAIPAGN